MSQNTESTEYLFLSPQWVHEVTKVVQSAHRTNEDFGKMASGFSLTLVYLIRSLPQHLRDMYGRHDRAVIFVKLDKGTIRKIRIGTELPKEDVDFTVASDYRTARDTFEGKLNAATSFINNVFQVEPMQRFYQQPRFAAKSIVAGNMILNIARNVPSAFAGICCGSDDLKQPRSGCM